MKRYNNYHKHTHYSSIFTPDSEAKIKDYINRAKELGHTTYFTTEHGYMGSIFEAYSLCKENGLKCIAAMEGYIVVDPLEKDDSNYHIMLIPTNNNSRKKLNKANSRANKEGRYYKPRLFLEDLLEFNPSELYITNACVGGLLKDDISFNNIMLPLINHFGNHFLIEVQSHNDERQKELNKKALDIANKYNLRLIHANDSHYIYPEDSKYRDILLEGKGIKYEEETNFILDYPDYNTIVERYKIQGVLNENQIKEALDTTLIFDDIDNLLLDKEIKMPNIYPNLSPKERLEKLQNIINENYKKIRIEDKITPEENSLYIKAIREEFDVIQGTMEINTMDYFLLNYKLINLAINKYGGVLTTTSRGSAGAFYINRLLGITQLDRVRAKIPLYYERFMSRSRLLENRSMPDCDFNVADPEPFRKASRELLGENGCHWMMAYGTMQESEAFRNLCRSRKIPFEEFNLIGKDLDKYRNDEKWGPIINECQRFIGTIISASAHPCSNLLYDKDLEEELGIIKLGDFYCCPITSSEADEWHYLKNDYLTVTTVDMTKKTFDLIGIPRMSLIELENALDDKVWDIYSKGLTCTVNQMDSNYATSYAMKYKPKSVYELAMLTGAIRPNFADYREDFVERRKYSNPVKKMDDLFASTNHFVLFQENLMQFFEWLGISPSKSIGLIKKISKKKIKKEDFDNLTVTLKENWIKENGSLDGFEETWEKIQSMISYGYNSPHALAMAYDSLYNAYLKSHYPLEYYSVALNYYNNDEERTKKLSSELSYFNISLKKPTFRYSKSTYFMDKETNAIYKGTSSIKFLNATASNYLYSLRDNKYNDFVDLLIQITNDKDDEGRAYINSRQLEILIKLQFFEEFGHNGKLLDVYKAFTSLYGRKVIQKDKISELPVSLDIVAENALTETDKQYRDVNIEKILHEYEKSAPNNNLKVSEQIKFEMEILGYINTTYPEVERSICLVKDIDTKFTPKATIYCLKNGKEIECKINKKTFKAKPFKKNSLIKANKFEKKPKWIKVEEGFEKSTTETEWHLVNYQIMNEEELC